MGREEVGEREQSLEELSKLIKQLRISLKSNREPLKPSSDIITFAF